MIRVVNAKPERMLHWLAGTDLKKGQFAVLDSGEAKAAAENITAATLLGLVMEDCDDAATATIYPVIGTEFEFDIYQGGAVDEATAAMIGTAYDTYVDGAAGDGSGEGEHYLDLNDTSGGFVYLMSYNNNTKKAYGRISLPDCFIA